MSGYATSLIDAAHLWQAEIAVVQEKCYEIKISHTKERRLFEIIAHVCSRCHTASLMTYFVFKIVNYNRHTRFQAHSFNIYAYFKTFSLVLFFIYHRYSPTFPYLRTS